MLNASQQPLGRPRVIAHRGSSLDHPEHSRAAYLAALADGADGLECDIRLSQDLVPLLMHDSRIDATTSGTGPLGEQPAAVLDRVEVHARSGRAAGRRARSAAPGEHETGVLRLTGFLEIAVGAGRPVELAIETKHPARAGRHIEAAVLEALGAFPLLRPKAGIMSFSAGALRRLRTLDAGLPTVLLLSDLPVGHRLTSLPAGVDVAGPSVRQLRRDPELVRRMHDAGHEVHVWTVDDDPDIDHCAGLGVDAIISNRPGHVLRRLGG